MKKINICWLVGWVFLATGGIQLQAKPWREIVPLITTRLEVERILGKPNKYKRYDLDEGRIYVNYASGSCERRGSCECLVPNDTVLDIFIVMNSDIKLSELGVSKDALKRQPKGHAADLSAYVNPKEGVSYTINDMTDEVVTITYFASAKDCQQIVSKGSRQHLKTK
jgi:hypothetical protein